MSDTDTLTRPPAPVDLDDARAQADATAGDDKPKRKRPAGKTRARPDAAPRGGARTPALAKRLEETITTLGTFVLFVNPRDGQLIIAGAAKQAAALDALAKENPAVKRALERMLTVSIWGQLLGAFAPTLIGIAANHGVVPPALGMLAPTAPAPTPAPDADAPPAGLASMLAGMSADDLAGLAEMGAAMMGGGDGAPFGRIVGLG